MKLSWFELIHSVIHFELPNQSAGCAQIFPDLENADCTELAHAGNGHASKMAQKFTDVGV